MSNEWDKVIQMYKNGVMISQISKNLKVSRAFVNRVLLAEKLIKENESKYAINRKSIKLRAKKPYGENDKKTLKVLKKQQSKSGKLRKIDREEIEKLISYGLNDTEIALRISCSPHTIMNIRINELGILKRKKGNKQYYDDEARRVLAKLVFELKNMGFNRKRIAKLCGIKTKGLTNLINEVLEKKETNLDQEQILEMYEK